MRRRSFLLALACAALDAASARAGVRVAPQSVSGTAGEQVAIAVRLHVDGDQEVAGTQSDLVFDSHTPIAASGDGRPACTVEPAIDKSATSFAFLPPHCVPAARTCIAVRAVVVAFDNREPIEPGSILFRCAVAIAPDAPAAAYPLAVLPGLYATPAGGDRPAGGGSALVEVRGSTPDPTPTAPAATPTATITTPDVPGDVNCDSDVTAADADAVVTALFMPSLACDTDCNRDGRVDAADVVCVGRAVAGDAINRRPPASSRFEYDESTKGSAETLRWR